MSLTERFVLSRLEGAVEDGKHLLWVHGAVEWLNVHNVHVRTGPYSVDRLQRRHGWQVLPNICNQLAAAIVRVVSSVVNVDDFRCEIFTDDPRGKVTHLWCRAADHRCPGCVARMFVPWSARL